MYVSQHSLSDRREGMPLSSEERKYIDSLSSILSADLIQNILSKDDINAYDNKGWTALHYAVMFGQKDMVEKLLKKRAACKMVKQSTSALLLAVQMGEKNIVQLLLDHWTEAEILQSNFEDQNALHVATQSNKIEIAKILLNNKIFHHRLEEEDLYGRTPLH